MVNKITPPVNKMFLLILALSLLSFFIHFKLLVKNIKNTFETTAKEKCQPCDSGMTVDSKSSFDVDGMDCSYAKWGDKRGILCKRRGELR